MILNDIISEPRTGCVGEFATFGFLSFLISLLNTLLNLGKITTISKQTICSILRYLIVDQNYLVLRGHP